VIPKKQETGINGAVRIPVYLGPLIIPSLNEEPGAANNAQRAQSLLGDILNDRNDPMGLVNRRYKEVTDPSVEPVVSPDHPVITTHVIRPLREAKCCYVLGMPVACIAQAGLVGEMVALWRFRMLEPKLDGRVLDGELQKLLLEREFDKLGQEERVRILRALEVLDEEMIHAFGKLRALRRQYLHFMIDPAGQDVDADARMAYQLACKLVAKTLDVKYATGALLLPPRVMQFIRDIVNTTKPSASAPPDG